MKWFQRREFVKDIKKLEKDLHVPTKDLSFLDDHKLQLYVQKLYRLKKIAKG